VNHELYKNWSTITEEILEPPSTVNQAVDRLLIILSPDDLHEIGLMQENDLYDLHFSLGLDIRNAFGLNVSGSLLLEACGVKLADDASHLIMCALRKRLRNTNA